MEFIIDQAGKVEQTSDDTILALCSEEIQYTIKIPKRLKQEIFNSCSKKHKKNLTLRIFSFCLFLLLKDRTQYSQIITIDNEYPGHEKDIKALLLNHLRINPNHIRFREIGKDCSSHRIANQTFSGKLKPNEIISREQLNLDNFIPARKQKEFLK